MSSPEPKFKTNVQNVLVVLFILTIALSCLSLVWYMVEKPNLKKTHCEQLGKSTSYISDSYNLGNQSSMIMPKLQRNCTTEYNPPISAGLDIMINLSIICGILFFVAAICAYVFRKNLTEEPVMEPKEEDKKQ